MNISTIPIEEIIKSKKIRGLIHAKESDTAGICLGFENGKKKKRFFIFKIILFSFLMKKIGNSLIME